MEYTKKHLREWKKYLERVRMELSAQRDDCNQGGNDSDNNNHKNGTNVKRYKYK